MCLTVLGAVPLVSGAVPLDLAELELQHHLLKYRPSSSQVLVVQQLNHLAFRPRQHHHLELVSQLVSEVLRPLQASVLPEEPRPLMPQRRTLLANLPAPLVSDSVPKIGNGKQANMLQHQLQLKNMPTWRKETKDSDPKWKTVSNPPTYVATSITLNVTFLRDFHLTNHTCCIQLIAHSIIDKIVPNDPSSGLFAIFDGHGGRQVSDYCMERFPIEMKKELVKNPADLT